MSKSESSSFGDLLRAFRMRKSLKQDKLAYMIGKHNRASITAWEGNQYLPGDRDVIIRLARALSLSEIETDNLLLAAHFPPEYQTLESITKAKTAQKNIFLTDKIPSVERLDKDYASSRSLALLPIHIIDELYYPLPGREQNLQELLLVLQDPQGAPAVIIDGLGGMGKTALAVELARRAIAQQLFERVIGDSAKQEQLVGRTIVQIDNSVLNFESLLDTLARQLDHWEIPMLQPEEKHTKLGQLLRQHRYLILIDNLETVDNAQELLARLRGFLSGSRALVTSRKRVYHNFVRPLSLQKLDLDDALFFIQQDLRQHARNPLTHTPQEKLVEIWEVTEGAPLAIKLVVAQARFFDLKVVLEQLKQANSDIYPFIFRQSWERLSLTAQFILIYIGTTVPTTVSWEELAGIKEIAESEGELLKGISELIDYSLLDVYSFPDHIRYGIHQLTRQFVNSSLPEMW